MDAGRCVEHPFMPVSGNCARCGRFTCRLCPPGAGPEEPFRCSPCAWRDGIRGGALQIGGWLVAFGVLLIYKIAVSGWLVLVSILASSDDTTRQGALAYFFVTLFVATLFFRRRRIAPTALIVTGLFDLAFVLPRKLLWPDGTIERLGVVALWAVPAMMISSLVYLLISKRVKRTFVLPGL